MNKEQLLFFKQLELEALKAKAFMLGCVAFWIVVINLCLFFI